MRSLVPPGYVGRMRGYLAEMFPLPRHLLMATLTYLSIAAFAGRIHQQTSSLVSLYTAIGILSIFTMLLILRLMDELKDRDIDLELFPERPLPSGRVLESDIRLSLVAVSLFYLLVNMLAGKAVWVALLVLGYAWLMFRRFFMPDRLRKSLFLTLATHTPIVPLMLVNGFVIFAAEPGLTYEEVRWGLVLPFIIMIWAGVLAWEVCRKIRSPQEETAYVTYSKILGPTGAVLLAGGAQGLAFCLGTYFYFTLSLSKAYLGFLVAALALLVWAYLRFLIHRTPATSKLKPFAEVFLIGIFLAQILEFNAFT